MHWWCISFDDLFHWLDFYQQLTFLNSWNGVFLRWLRWNENLPNLLAFHLQKHYRRLGRACIQLLGKRLYRASIHCLDHDYFHLVCLANQSMDPSRHRLQSPDRHHRQDLFRHHRKPNRAQIPIPVRNEQRNLSPFQLLRYIGECRLFHPIQQCWFTELKNCLVGRLYLGC